MLRMYNNMCFKYWVRVHGVLNGMVTYMGQSNTYGLWFLVSIQQNYSQLKWTHLKWTLSVVPWWYVSYHN